MAVNWSLYETLVGNGQVATRREVAIGESVNAFVNGMVDDPAYQSDAIVDGKLTPIVASRKSAMVCAIKAAPNANIHIGDSVECFGEQWIVVDLHADKVGIIGGEMWLCNHTLRFQNRSTVVVTRHCVIDDGTYAKKSSDPSVYTMANTYKVYISLDESTRQLFVDKRLALGQIFSSAGDLILEVYKIIGIDVKSKNFGSGSHLMVLTIQRDVYDPNTDSISENICDIYTGEQDDSKPQTTGSCAISGRDSIRLGTNRKYTATFIDASGAIVDVESPIWQVSAPAGITYVMSNGECTIGVPLDEQYVGEVIEITLSDPDGLFGSYNKKVQVITVG